MCCNCNNDEDGSRPDPDKYYIVFGRKSALAVEIFLAFVQTGDDEFDAVARKLGLQSFSFVENCFEAAEEFARLDARKIDAALPVEIRFLEDGDISSPSGLFLLPVDALKPQTCKTCGCGALNLKHWLSFWKWGYPVFCSHKCSRRWYEEIPFSAAPDQAANSSAEQSEAVYEVD